MLTRPVTCLAVCLTLIAAAGCSSQDIADSAAEKIAERAGGENTDVSIDSESGEMKIETEDGSMSFGTADLPDEWPSEIPLPSEYTLDTAMQAGSGGEQSFTISGTLTGDPDAEFDELVASFEADGWEELQKATASFGDGKRSNAGFDNGTWTAMFAVSSGEGDPTFSYTVIPSES